MPHKKRIKQLSSLIHYQALLIEHPTNIFYLTGLELSAGKLLVTTQGAHLIVDGRYYEKCQKHCPCAVYLLDKMPLKLWLEEHKIKELAFESEFTSYHAFHHLQKMAHEIGGFTLIPTESPVLAMRLIKDKTEIQLLTEAAQLGWKGYEHVVSLLKEGITEGELAFELEFFWKKRGAQKLAFDPIIAFGANSSMPHYRAGSTALQKNTSVLIDIGVTLKHYHSDMTRVVFFGKPPKQIKEIYSIVEEAKNKTLELCRPGTLIGDLDKAARSVIDKKGYGSYFTHSTGHGLGLDVHELPTLRSKGPFTDIPLKPGMVITIEPGIYLPDIGGVRLEDTVLITREGHKNLTETIS